MKVGRKNILAIAWALLLPVCSPIETVSPPHREQEHVELPADKEPENLIKLHGVDCNTLPNDTEEEKRVINACMVVNCQKPITDNMNLSRIDFKNYSCPDIKLASAQGIDFSGADLVGFIFKNTMYPEESLLLTGTKFNGARLKDARFDKVFWNKIEARGADFLQAIFKDVTFSENPSFYNKDTSFVKATFKNISGPFLGANRLGLSNIMCARIIGDVDEKVFENMRYKTIEHLDYTRGFPDSVVTKWKDLNLYPFDINEKQLLKRCPNLTDIL